MNDFLAKPIEPEKLWKALVTWIPPRSSDLATAPPPEIASAWSAHLPDGVAGLDTKQAMRRLMGNADLYLSLLRKFKSGQRESVGQIRQALQADDHARAELLAHTLKGVAAGLGASRVQEVAAQLESAIKLKGAQAVLEELLAHLEMVLAELITALDAELPVPEASGTPPCTAVYPEVLKGVCLRLKSLLEEGDAEAFDLFDAHADLLQAAFGDRYALLKTGIENYDCLQALETLDDCMLSTEIPI